MGDTAARPPAVNRRPYLFASASRLPLLGLGDEIARIERSAAAYESTATGAAFADAVYGDVFRKPPTRREQMDELVRISNRQTVLHHLHPRRERQAYEDAQ